MPQPKATPQDAPSSAPSIVDKIKLKFPIVGRLITAYQRFSDKNGNFYAAGITYFTVFAMFPILMVSFATLAFVLAGNQTLMDQIHSAINQRLGTGATGSQVKGLIDSAIDQRGSIFSVGILGAIWAGLGWVGNLRQALTEQWEGEPKNPNFAVKKVVDLAYMVLLLVSLIITLTLSILGASAASLMRALPGVQYVPGQPALFAFIGIALSVLASWMMWTFVIAKMPRIQLPFKNALVSGFIMAVAFQILLQLLQFLLKSVMKGPAWGVFGPVLALMVFFYYTYRLLLFCTAWAATTPANRKFEATPVPDPVVFSPHIVDDEPSTRGMLAAAAVGALAMLGVTGVFKRLR